MLIIIDAANFMQIPCSYIALTAAYLTRMRAGDDEEDEQEPVHCKRGRRNRELATDQRTFSAHPMYSSICSNFRPAQSSRIGPLMMMVTYMVHGTPFNCTSFAGLLRHVFMPSIAPVENFVFLLLQIWRAAVATQRKASLV